jgi:hypothetical protein
LDVARFDDAAPAARLNVVNASHAPAPLQLVSGTVCATGCPPMRGLTVTATVAPEPRRRTPDRAGSGQDDVDGTESALWNGGDGGAADRRDRHGRVHRIGQRSGTDNPQRHRRGIELRLRRRVDRFKADATIGARVAASGAREEAARSSSSELGRDKPDGAPGSASAE